MQIEPGAACTPHISCILDARCVFIWQLFHLKRAAMQYLPPKKYNSYLLLLKLDDEDEQRRSPTCAVRGGRSGIMYESSVPFLRAVRALYAPRHAALHRLMTSWPRNRGFHQPRPPLSTKRLDRQSFCYDCWALLCNQFQCFCLNDVYVRCVRVS